MRHRLVVLDQVKEVLGVGREGLLFLNMLKLGFDFIDNDEELSLRQTRRECFLPLESLNYVIDLLGYCS